MEILSSKYNTLGAPPKAPKSTTPKTGFTFDKANVYNKENIADQAPKDKYNSRPDENSKLQARARSLERRNTNQSQPSLSFNKTENTMISATLAELGNFFNSPKGIETELFKSQDRNSYQRKHGSRTLKTSFKQEEKTSQNNSIDQALQAKIDQIVNSSFSIKDRSRYSNSMSKVNPAPSGTFEEKTSEKLTLYTRLLSEMKNATPKSKDFGNEDRDKVSTKATIMTSSIELYPKSMEAKKPYLDLKISSVELDSNSKNVKEDSKTTGNFQRISFSHKKPEKPEENGKIEKEKFKEQAGRGLSAKKQEKFTPVRGLSVNNSQPTPVDTKYPMTVKGTKSGLRYNENQNLYESLTNLKKTLEKPPNNLAKSTAFNGSIQNHILHTEGNKESKNLFKSMTPKAHTMTNTEVKNILQSFKNILHRDNKTQESEEKVSLNGSIKKEEVYQKYLRESSNTREERATPPQATLYNQRPPSSSKVAKHRESSSNPNKKPEEQNINFSQANNQEKPPQKSLKDFVTQVNPAGGMPLKPKLDINVQNNEHQNYSNLQAQSAKHVTRSVLNDKYLTTNSPNALNINRAVNTTTNSGITQESKSFVFNQNLSKNPLRSSMNLSDERASPATAGHVKKDSQGLISTVCEYYLAGIEKYLKNSNIDNNDYFAKIYREHFLQAFQAINFCKYLKPVDPTELAKKKVYLPKRESHKDKKTIVFDLDETLIHCNENASIPSDVILPIKFPHGDVIEAGINIRPYAAEALEELSKHFEIIVFTASHSCYANVVLDYLDPNGEYIHHRLFRESCVTTEEGLYIKDLRIFANRNLKDMVIVDNAMYSFGYQLENGIPIIPYYYHKGDKELKTLVTYLKGLLSAKDVRDVNIRSFKLHAFAESESHEEVLKKLFES